MKSSRGESVHEASAGQRGRLKIFLGAAPGVGKTYQMLRAAQSRRRDGADVVVGLVETHGRRETDDQLRGLEEIPRKRLEYKDHVFEEMDIDALLERRPDLVIVDELAHSNVPGSRNAKRWLDVLELIGAGIDVYTTVNVQHVESLNDTVAKTTWTVVHETVPDSMLELADEIEVVDLSPGDLIERLRQGKVDLSGHPGSASHSFFSERNLTSLRSLARRLAKSPPVRRICPVRRVAERNSCCGACHFPGQGRPSWHYLAAERSSASRERHIPGYRFRRGGPGSRRGHTGRGFAATRCAADSLPMRSPCRPAARGDRCCRRTAPDRLDRHGVNRPETFGAAFFGVCRDGCG